MHILDALNSVNGNSVVLDSDDSTNQLNKKESTYGISKEIDNLKKQPSKNEYSEEENEQIDDDLSKKSVSTSTNHKKKQTSDTIVKPVICKPIKQVGKTEKLVQTSITGRSNEERNKTYKDEQTVTDPVDNRVLKSQISDNEVNSMR